MILKKEFSTPILIVLVVCLSALSGLFVVPKKAKLCETVKSDKANYYNNYLSNFSLSIPSGLKIEEGFCDKYPLLSIYYSVNSDEHKVEVGIEDKIRGLSLSDQVIKNNDSYTKIDKKESVTISGLEAYHEIGFGAGNFESYHILNGEKIITIIRYYSKYSDDAIFNSIVNSIKKLN